MNILIFIVVVLVVAALVCYLVQLLPFIPPPFKNIITIVVVLFTIIAICYRAGWVRSSEVLTTDSLTPRK